MTDFRVKRFNPYSADELIEALQRYAKETESQFISSRAFCRSFNIAPATVERRFGSWSGFCAAAGVHPRYNRQADRLALLWNLDEVWRKLGRQPRAKEMKQPLSSLSISRYQKVFEKTWFEICIEFLSWRTGLPAQQIADQTRAESVTERAPTHKTQRNVSLSLRYDVLKRDGFKCVHCGRSPATEAGVQLHIDHIIPRSKEGETNAANLQTLCSDCNLGKSNKLP